MGWGDVVWYAIGLGRCDSTAHPELGFPAAFRVRRRARTPATQPYGSLQRRFHLVQPADDGVGAHVGVARAGVGIVRAAEPDATDAHALRPPDVVAQAVADHRG